MQVTHWFYINMSTQTWVTLTTEKNARSSLWGMSLPYIHLCQALPVHVSPLLWERYVSKLQHVSHPSVIWPLYTDDKP